MMASGAMGPRSNDFTSLLEHTVDAFTANDDSAVEDVRRILADIRKQYDDVHNEAEKKEAELQRLREAIRMADAGGTVRSDELYSLEDTRVLLSKQLDDTNEKIQEALTNKKVYNHILERLKKEQAVLKQKMMKMENHLSRKTLESTKKLHSSRKMQQGKTQAVLELELMEQDVEHERYLRESAVNGMMGTLQTKKNAIKRRADFERWRHEVALEAANEAFNASAGRLRKIWAIEKLAGNCLQKIIFEQVEKSQATEDGFQKIREVTGLTDVMDIVHKFLNRDVEHEQLKNAVKEAEAKLDALREEFERFKRDTDGITFDPDAAGRSRVIYQEVEDHEQTLNKALKDHELSRSRLQQSTLQVEHMKRWANRMSRSLAAFEDPVNIDKPADLLPFFQQLQHTVEKFIAHIQGQLSSGRVQRKTMSQAASKEYHEQARLLNDKEFIRSNCRVPVSADGRPASGGGHRQQGGNVEEDPAVALQNEREKYKMDATNKVNEALRKNEALQKKKAAK